MPSHCVRSSRASSARRLAGMRDEMAARLSAPMGSPLAVLMANATTRLGVVPTMSTSFYPPFLLARLASTIDHIARGRFG